jgi:DNA-binding transcriptional LysR family regulator
MIDWDDLRVFLALTKYQSQRGAGKHLDVDQATVGRRIKALETALGSKLFDRTSDGLVLNGTGQILLRHAKKVEDQIIELERSASARDHKHQGIVRVAIPGGLTHYWLMPQLKNFFENYPDNYGRYHDSFLSLPPGPAFDLNFVACYGVTNRLLRAADQTVG